MAAGDASRLRASLDGRGLDYTTYDMGRIDDEPIRETTWLAADGCAVTFYEYPGGATRLTAWGMGPEQAIEATLGAEVDENTSDGYHTFKELYHHRAVLFSVIVRLFPGLAWKSKLHHTGDMFDGMFIVGIETPSGQATYHYDIDPYWGMFKCRELERAPKWDGHTPEQAIERIATLGRPTAHRHVRSYGEYGNCSCSACHADVEPYDGFCHSCGTRLTHTVYERVGDDAGEGEL